MPPSIKRAGAGACATASSHVRQAYLGLRVTSTRNRAGTMSSRSETSSPIRCSWPLQQGHALSSRSTMISTRGRCVGNAPRFIRRFCARAARSAGAFFSTAASSLACFCSTSSNSNKVFEPEQKLIFRQRLGAAAEAVTLQLPDHLYETLVAQALGQQHRFQRRGIVGQPVIRRRHDGRRPYFPGLFEPFQHPDSLCRRHPGCAGAAISRAA